MEHITYYGPPSEKEKFKKEFKENTSKYWNALRYITQEDGTAILSIFNFSPFLKFRSWMIWWNHLGIICGNIEIETQKSRIN